MLLNHARKPVWHWNGHEDSLCPDCHEPLVAHKGEIVVWHWAHHPSKHTRERGCLTHESQWHLRWKLAYYGIPGWDIEVPVMGGKYRTDAMNTNRRTAREFVHSLSPSYTLKHYALMEAGLDLLWIWDGAEFQSERRRVVGGKFESGFKRLLKPTASAVHEEIGGLVHKDVPRPSLWRLWKHDIWYPTHGHGIDFLLDAYRSTAGTLDEVIKRIEDRRSSMDTTIAPS